MKKLAALLVTTLGLALAPATNAQSLFKESEFSVSLLGDYVDRAHEQWGIGASATYFFTPCFGLGATTHWEKFGSTVMDNLAVEGYFRYPLETVPLAPYAVATVGHSWATREWFESIGAGAELRLKGGWGVFADYQYFLNGRTADAGAFRTGIRFVF